MGRRPARTLILDAGALIALERADRRLAALLDAADRRPGSEVVVPAGALAQAWRGGRRSARIARLLGTLGVSVAPLARAEARAAGELCGARGTAGVIDASVVLAAREHDPALIVTADPGDLARLDPEAVLLVL
jgi:hypothetical protein